MRVLVTGGAGYIGSHTCKILQKHGYEPVVYDNLLTGHDWAVKWGELIIGDLNDYRLLCWAFKKYKIDLVMHFAASAYVGESIENPRKYYVNNVINSNNLFNAMVDCKIKYLVFSSSCAIYGLPDQLPMSEEHAQDPINPYGETKYTIERMLHWYNQAYNIKSVSLRYFNAAGADLEGELGEEHDPEPHLIPRVIKSALGLLDSVDIYGTDYPTEDGTAIRDYIHVDDLGEGHAKALNYLLNGGTYEAFNLGAGHGYSVLQVIKEVENLSGKTVTFRNMPRRAGDPAVLIADIKKSWEVLKWQPVSSSLETILKSSLKWFS